MASVNSIRAFSGIWKCWQIGGTQQVGKYTATYTIYSIFVTLTVVIFYPVSQTVKILQEKDLQVVLENLSVTITVVACSLKFFYMLFSQKDRVVLEIVEKLDQRIGSPEEQQCIKKAIKFCRKVFLIYAASFYTCLFFFDMAALFSRDRRLIVDGWFPFDVFAGANFWIAYFYQAFAGFIAISQNIACDAYPSVHLSVLTAHIDALAMRVKKIGWNSQSERNNALNYNLLVDCAKDHKDVISLFDEISSMVKITMFIQLLVTAFTLCVATISLLFITKQIFGNLANATYVLVIIMEVLPACYAMRGLRVCNARLTDSIYGCNWMDQDLRFQKLVIIFMQRTQKDFVIAAGHIFPVSLETFLTILKFSFSLFTVLSKLKK